MFFDFSHNKVLPIIIVLFMLGAGVLFFVAAGPESPVNPHSFGIFLGQTKAAFHYWWSFKLAAPENYKLLFTKDGLTALASNIFFGDTSYYYSNRSEGLARSIPVLLYHGESYESIELPNFMDQMHALKRAGWNTIGIDDFYVYIKDGKPLPDRSFLLTFDDGRKDSYYPTDPVLKDVGFTATMFVITGFSLPDAGKESSFYLSKAELLEMQRSGRWEFGSHGKNDHSWYQIGSSTDQIGHFLSNKLWLPIWLGSGAEQRVETDDEFKARVAEDLADSRTALESSLGKPAIAFAYPFNDFGQETVNYGDADAVLDEIMPDIYQMAFYQTLAGDGDTFNYPATGGYLMKRIEPAPEWSGEKLVQVLEESRAKELPYAQEGIFGGEWKDTWGEIVRGSSLTLKAAPHTTGAAVFLNGSKWWNDYSMTATVGLIRGSDVSLIARYHDSENFFMCTFSETRVKAEERVNGITKTLNQAPYAVPLSKNVDLGIAVNGSSGDCYVNGKQATGGTITNRVIRKNGSVGFQVWDSGLDVAHMNVTHIEANAR